MEALGTSNGAPTLILDRFSSVGVVSTSEIWETGVVVMVDTGEAPATEPTGTAWIPPGLTRACARAAGIGRKPLRGVWLGVDTTDPPGS